MTVARPVGDVVGGESSPVVIDAHVNSFFADADLDAHGAGSSVAENVADCFLDHPVDQTADVGVGDDAVEFDREFGGESACGKSAEQIADR